MNHPVLLEWSHLKSHHPFRCNTLALQNRDMWRKQVAVKACLVEFVHLKFDETHRIDSRVPCVQDSCAHE